MAATGQHHRGAGGTHRVGHLRVSLRPARLDDPRDDGSQRSLRAVGKGEERIGGEHRTAYVMTVLPRLVECDPHRIDAARLAAADADRREILREDNRVRTHVLAHTPGEDEVPPAGFVGLPAGDLHRLAVVDVPVAILYEQAAQDSLEIALPSREPTALAIAQDPDRLLPLQRLESALVVVR